MQKRVLNILYVNLAPPSIAATSAAPTLHETVPGENIKRTERIARRLASVPVYVVVNSEKEFVVMNGPERRLELFYFSARQTGRG